MNKIEIWQINLDAGDPEAEYFAFRNSDVLEKNEFREPIVEGGFYDCVWEGDVDTDCLEEVFQIFNERPPKDYRARSMSVSDVVYMDGKYYFCDDIGFKECEWIEPLYKRCANRNEEEENND